MSDTFYESESGDCAVTSFCRSSKKEPDRRGVQITGFKDEERRDRSFVCMSVPDAVRMAQEILRRYPEEAGYLGYKHIAEYNEKVARLKSEACAMTEAVSRVAELVSEL